MSTATTTGSPPARPQWIPSSLYRMTLGKYESLIASGFFSKRDDVHLINGYLVNRMPESALHGAVCEAIRLAIEAIPLATWHIRSEKGLRIPSRSSLPRPDLVVVRGACGTTWPGTPNRPTPPWSSRCPIRAWMRTGRWPTSTVPAASRSTGSSTWSTARSKSTPTRVLSGYQTHEVLAPGHVLRVVVDGVEIGEIAVADILP